MQGATLDHVTGDLNDSTKHPKKKISKFFLKGIVYTLLSRVRTRDTIRIQNFHEDLIVHNEEAVVEMERMRKESSFEFEHPLEKVQGNKICLNNIRGWNAHIAHFLSEKLLVAVFCVLLKRKQEIQSYVIFLIIRQVGKVSIILLLPVE